MLLRTTDVDGLRRGASVPSIPTTPQVTLAAAAELACTVAHQRSAGCSLLGEAADGWFRNFAPWRAMVAWLVDGRRPTAPDVFAAPVFELWPIEFEGDIVGTRWTEFQDRFRRSATNHGFTSRLGAALSMALREMCDNIVQHAGGVRGFAAYQVAEKRVAWTVVDVGRGVLASLRTSERWRSISTSEAALLAVWNDHASSRPDKLRGTGFGQVELSLAALNGHLRIRSGDAVLELSGTSGALRQTRRSNPELLGLQMGATCALGPVDDFPLTV